MSVSFYLIVFLIVAVRLGPAIVRFMDNRLMKIKHQCSKKETWIWNVIWSFLAFTVLFYIWVVIDELTMKKIDIKTQKVFDVGSLDENRLSFGMDYTDKNSPKISFVVKNVHGEYSIESFVYRKGFVQFGDKPGIYAICWSDKSILTNYTRSFDKAPRNSQCVGLSYFAILPSDSMEIDITKRSTE